VDVTVNIHNPQTALFCFRKPPKQTLLTTQFTPTGGLNSRLRKSVTLVVSTKGILLLYSTK